MASVPPGLVEAARAAGQWLQPRRLLMFGKFLPRETSFFDFFEQHAQLTAEGVREFLLLLEPGANIEARAKRIKEIEHETDVVTHRCVEALHKTFITPIERDDIYRLITKMDDITDNVEASAERIVLYDIKIMRPEAKEMCQVLIRCMEQIQKALRGLRSMKNAEPILQTCVEINQLENEADALLRAALARVFKEEKDPLTVIKWKEVFEYLETASDRCEDVAQIIEGVVLEHA
jgi:predicted phosphate transport protein (TIGR00153 family)